MDLSKAVGGFLVLMLVLMVVFVAGYFYSNSKSAPKLAALQAQLSAADAAAKQLVAKQKENEHEITDEISSSVGRINSKYDSLLQRQGAAHADALAKCTETANATADELQTAYRDAVEFKRACTLDANTIVEWQNWAIKNQIPVAQ